jgi:hypothetical protein
MIDSKGGAFGFDCCLASPKFRVFQQPARRGDDATNRVLASLSHRRLNRAEQANKLNIFVVGWTRKCPALARRETVVGHGIRQRTHYHSTLSFIDHDLVFVVDRHQQSPIVQVD